jgi:hypothetical protein
MNDFIVAVKKPVPVPPVTKVGLKEYLLEYIVDGDLVCVYLLSLGCIFT